MECKKYEFKCYKKYTSALGNNIYKPVCKHCGSFESNHVKEYDTFAIINQQIHDDNKNCTLCNNDGIFIKNAENCKFCNPTNRLIICKECSNGKTHKQYGCFPFSCIKITRTEKCKKCNGRGYMYCKNCYSRCHKCWPRQFYRYGTFGPFN